jgi:hypothetical protein
MKIPSRNCLLIYDAVWSGFQLRVRRVRTGGSSTTWVNYDAYHEQMLFVSPSKSKSLRCRVAEERKIQGTATTKRLCKAVIHATAWVPITLHRGHTLPYALMTHRSALWGSHWCAEYSNGKGATESHGLIRRLSGHKPVRVWNERGEMLEGRSSMIFPALINT